MPATNKSSPTHRRAWLELIRLRELPAVIADPLAGAVIAGATWRQAHMVVLVMLASAMLWAGAAALGDWANLSRDRTRRPSRPLPSRRINRWHAMIAGLALLAASVSVADSASQTATRVTFVMIAVVGLGRFLLHEVPIAFPLEGAFRALNLLLGMVLVPIVASPAHIGVRIYLMITIGLYATGLTLLLEPDVHRYRSSRLITIAPLIVLPGLMIVALPLICSAAAVSFMGLLWAGLALAGVGYCLTQAILAPAGRTVLRAIDVTALGAVLLNSAAAAYMRHPAASILLAASLVPAVWVMWHTSRASQDASSTNSSNT
ncbi:MAG TPA: hypothetical protein VLM89_03285 [Phycisphaerae bacterium]|nr:hypothetical protein [Phycisphaerae bacterium]